MSSDTTLSSPATEADSSDDHESHDITDKQYIIIAFLLAVLTGAEVLVSYTDIGSWMIPILLVMMAVKFLTVVSYFMHLKFDSRLFALVFYIGVAMAIVLFCIMLTTFHFFTG